jgi:hypothetical protein
MQEFCWVGRVSKLVVLGCKFLAVGGKLLLAGFCSGYCIADLYSVVLN